MERQFSYPTIGPVMLGMTFWLHSSEQGGVNAWPVVALIGNFDPRDRGAVHHRRRGHQVVGWKQYTYTATVLPGKVWVAFGFGATGGRSACTTSNLVQFGHT